MILTYQDFSFYIHFVCFKLKFEFEEKKCVVKLQLMLVTFENLLILQDLNSLSQILLQSLMTSNTIP